MAAESSVGVKSVSRVFDLLELIADSRRRCHDQPAVHCGRAALPTIHRLLRTLVAEGYARQLANRRYALGPKLVRLGEVANRQFGLMAMPQLKSLVARLGETANLATIDGDGVVYVSQAPSPHAMRMFTEVGGRAPLHSTSVGKAILAQLGDDQVREIITRAGMPHSTPRSLDTIDALLADLALSRERGYAVDDGEHEIGVRCFAMAVPNMPVLTAVSVSGPMSRVGEDFAEQAIPVLREVVADISAVTNAS
jgi:IclR family acetate operon transcriptional repressor